MRTLLGLFLAAALCPALPAQEKVVFTDDFEKGLDRWQFHDPAAWKVTKEGTNQFLQLHQQSKYKPPFRSPVNIALVKDLAVTDFILEVKVLSRVTDKIKDAAHRDMCFYWGYQDPSHFYYCHIAQKADDHANQIFIVNGKERVKISTKTNAGNKWDDEWHRVKIVRNTATGTMEVYRDDMTTPIITADDKTFTWGQLGVGSFDDTGLFDDVKIQGTKYTK